MIELDEMTRALLDEIRAERDPSAEVGARVWTAVRASVSGPLPGPGGPGGPGGAEVAAGGAGGAEVVGAATPWFAAKVAGATLVLAGAGLLTLKVGADAYRVAKVRETEPVESSSLPPSTRPTPDPAEPTSAGPDKRVDERPRREARDDAGPASPEPAPAEPDAGGRGAGSSSPASPALGVEAELALIRTAREAAGPREMLVELGVHASRFPDGALAAERELMRIEASCELGLVDQARSWAGRFELRFPSSPLRARVEASCVGAEGEGR